MISIRHNVIFLTNTCPVNAASFLPTLHTTYFHFIYGQSIIRWRNHVIQIYNNYDTLQPFDVGFHIPLAFAYIGNNQWGNTFSAQRNIPSNMVYPASDFDKIERQALHISTSNIFFSNAIYWFNAIYITNRHRLRDSLYHSTTKSSQNLIGFLAPHHESMDTMVWSLTKLELFQSTHLFSFHQWLERDLHYRSLLQHFYDSLASSLNMGSLLIPT